MVIEPPPSLSQPSTPAAVSILTGIAGVGAAIGAGSSGFLEQWISTRALAFGWGSALALAAVAALIGSVLSLAAHDVGPPIVAGACAVIAAATFSTLAADGVDVSALLDDWPTRGLLFIGGGVAAALGVVLGLAACRGRAHGALGAIVSLLSLGWLAAVAFQLRLDDRRFEFTVKPFLGFALVVAVSIIGALVGRYGILAAVTGAAVLLPRFLLAAEFDNGRQPASVAAVLAATGAIVIGVAASLLAARQPAPAFGTGAWPPQASPFDVSPDDTNVMYALPAPGGSPFHTDRVPVVHQPPVPAPTPAAHAVSVVPQWAPDPYGRHQIRYWDGTRWTESVQDNGVAATDVI
jgi:hypothetical protein